MEGLDLANRLFGATTREPLLETLRAEQEALRREGPAGGGEAGARSTPLPARSSVSGSVPIPSPPDLDLHVLRDVPLTHIYPFLNLQMLLGKHLGVKGAVSRLIAEGDPRAHEMRDHLETLKHEARSRGLIRADGLYRFYRAAAAGDAVILHDADREVARFTFPRQPGGERLCLADYVRDATSGERDYVALFAVTCGRGVRELAETYKERGEYLRSHLLQALAIECAEAFAEMLHSRLRTQWGFPDPLDLTLAEKFKAHYRGVRVSFGYPACPNLADQRILFDLLRPEQIGLTLTEGYMMDPEASVSALVFHHPEAKYFKAEGGDAIG
jgi:5-methyltetrahydrofolate--homocysteine methyltransferase